MQCFKVYFFFVVWFRLQLLFHSVWLFLIGRNSLYFYLNICWLNRGSTFHKVYCHNENELFHHDLRRTLKSGLKWTQIIFNLSVQTQLILYTLFNLVSIYKNMSLEFLWNLHCGFKIWHCISTARENKDLFLFHFPTFNAFRRSFYPKRLIAHLSSSYFITVCPRGPNPWPLYCLSNAPPVELQDLLSWSSCQQFFSSDWKCQKNKKQKWGKKHTKESRPMPWLNSLL